MVTTAECSHRAWVWNRKLQLRLIDPHTLSDITQRRALAKGAAGADARAAAAAAGRGHRVWRSAVRSGNPQVTSFGCLNAQGLMTRQSAFDFLQNNSVRGCVNADRPHMRIHLT